MLTVLVLSALLPAAAPPETRTDAHGDRGEEKDHRFGRLIPIEDCPKAYGTKLPSADTRGARGRHVDSVASQAVDKSTPARAARSHPEADGGLVMRRPDAHGAPVRAGSNLAGNDSAGRPVADLGDGVCVLIGAALRGRVSCR